jgi:lipopolysaccharide export system protein LptC
MISGAAAARGDIMPNEGSGKFGEGVNPANPARARAFRAAARHSARIRWLRRAIVVGAVAGTVGLVWYSYFRASAVGDINFSLENFGISGDKITMQRPRLTGVRRDGKPYDVTAVSGVQNPKDPTRTALTKLDAKLRMADDSDTRITGDTGTYDSSSQVLDLSGDVQIKASNFLLSMRSATMNFKTNVFGSNEPVRLDFNNGWIEAESLSSTENGGEISFRGNVRSQFVQPPEAAAPDPGQNSGQNSGQGPDREGR